MTDMIYYYHPNIQLNFFEQINTKNKSYWLGILYADGYLKTNKNKPYRIGIEVDIKDQWIINEFIKDLGLNSKFIRKKEGKVCFEFASKKVVEDLINNGLIPGKRKSKNIELPQLENRDLYLAFLLGFFDGDGTQKTTKITTGSIKFLKQIKEKFNLNYKTELIKSGGPIEGREIHGTAYRMALGSKLFNEMLDNYEFSLPRKRCRFKTEEERIISLKKQAWKGSHKRKFEISKNKLMKLVQVMPLYKIGNKYGVSNTTVKKYCVKWGIKTPPQGYWLKKADK